MVLFAAFKHLVDAKKTDNDKDFFEVAHQSISAGEIAIPVEAKFNAAFYVFALSVNPAGKFGLSVPLVIEGSTEGDGSGEGQGYTPPPAPTPPTLSEGDTVARLSLEDRPAKNLFLLRGTVPLPEKFYFKGNDIPFAIKNPDGSLTPAQVEKVTSYANPQADGVSVVEITAEVKNPGAQTGPAAYDVVVSHYAAPSAPSGSTAQILLSQGNLAPGAIDLLTTHKNKLRIWIEDYAGNKYETKLFADSNHTTALGSGLVSKAAMNYSVMMPTIQSPSALPNAFGIHNYSEVVGKEISKGIPLIDLRISLGSHGMQTSAGKLNFIKDMFYKYIKIAVPQGYSLITRGAYPAFSGSYINVGDEKHYYLVDPRPDGKLHSALENSAMFRSIGIVPDSDVTNSKGVLLRDGQAFSTPGSNAQGVQLFDWSNPLTANLMADGYRETLNPALLGPSFNIQNVRQHLKNEYLAIQSDIEAGNTVTKTSYELGMNGNFQDSDKNPGENPYKGKTGGQLVHQIIGSHIRFAASRFGFLYDLAYGERIKDRHRISIYNPDGSELEVNDILVDCPNNYPAPKGTSVSFLQDVLTLKTSMVDPLEFNTAKSQKAQSGSSEPTGA